MRVRPVDVSVLDEPCNALPYRHCSFHVLNRPQSGRQLKYFMHLVAIGFAYGRDRSEVTDVSYSSGPDNQLCRATHLPLKIYSALQGKHCAATI